MLARLLAAAASWFQRRPAVRLLPDGAPWAGVQRLVSIEGPARASAFLRARRRAARHPDDDWQRRRAERAYGMAEGSAQFDRELDVEVAGRAANTIRL